MTDAPQKRPTLVAIAGSNGAGKTTFFDTYLRETGLPFVNADDLAQALSISAYEAAEIATVLRRELIKRRESFAFETVLSDPVCDKVSLLSDAVKAGYDVTLYFIGISTAKVSEERVALRICQGGHEVPPEKLEARFPRTLRNLRAAIRRLPSVLIFDNDDLASPFREVAEFRDGKPLMLLEPVPEWLRSAMGKPPH